VDLGVLRTQLRDIASPVVSSAGYDLEELTVARVGRKHLVRITVDGDDGVSLDVIARLSRLISAALDEAEASAGPFRIDSYDLEVSSPGVDRPLTLPRHWRRNVGRLVKVRLGDRLLTGRIEAVDGTAVTLDVAGERRTVALDQVGPGRVQIEFSRLDGLADEDFGDEFGDDEEGGAE
jgi:ribosome maturation factor RimP